MPLLLFPPSRDRQPGPPHINVKVIFRLESIDQDIQVQFSHPGDDRLPRILIRFD